ncbi:hypothetical protein GUJ93_ZPchr2169g6446 [Zizania palustris]|uniref:Uncharacterized protein n=1 Tax=Zizania palustris TaxID=103762 RepID=A0A8J5RD46_ZIZPA|nr:hypothetical protein GUJ93_ZPchr2169g6446 [Zizania palustris]
MEKALTKIGNSLAPRRPSRSSPPLATISLLVYVLYVLVSLGEDGQGKKKPYVLASFDPRQVRRLHRLCSSGVVPPLSTMVSYWHLHPSRVSRADSLFETEVETLTEALESANNVVLSTISMIFVTMYSSNVLSLTNTATKVALRLVRPAKKVIVEKAHKTVVP